MRQQKLGHLAKSLLTIQNAYDTSTDVASPPVHKGYDLKHTYLNKDQQIREYKKLLSICDDVRDISFLIIGLYKLQNIDIDYARFREIAMEIIKSKLDKIGVRALAKEAGVSTSVIHKAYYGFITNDMAISIAYIYQPDLFKEVVE